MPTDDLVVEAMLDMADVHEKDVLYDLGCGDGRIVVAAAMEREARAVGIDMDPMRIEEARDFAYMVGVEHLVEFIQGDLLEADFSEATVLTLYLLPTINAQLRPRILRELKPGTRIIANSFNMGEWKADQRRAVGGVYIYKWIVPALVEGTWKWRTADGKLYCVDLQQKYQKLSGNAWVDNQPAELVKATLSGTQLVLEILEQGAEASEVFISQHKGKKRKTEAEDINDLAFVKR